jgi:hypothetical protein
MDEATDKEARNNETNGERGKEKNGEKKKIKLKMFAFEYELNSDTWFLS